MGKVILVHANCIEVQAKGDFVFAGSLAKDLANEIKAQRLEPIDIILVSTADGISRFEELYGSSVDGRIMVENVSVGLVALERFDPVANSVVAFVDANHCKHPPAALVKRILEPDSKLLFVSNANQVTLSALNKTGYCAKLDRDQPDLYHFFDKDDLFTGTVGFDAQRLGLPNMVSAKDLPELPSSQKESMPKGAYGFMYLKEMYAFNDYQLIGQYMKLTDLRQYVLVMGAVPNLLATRHAYGCEMASNNGITDFPLIHSYTSLPKNQMRIMASNASSTLVLSTGITSTLEAMDDNKLPYYQTMRSNAGFVRDYLQAVKSIVFSATSMTGSLSDEVIALAEVLFSHKPLSPKQMQETNELLKAPAVSAQLIRVNRTILDKANGKVAPLLLGFLSGPRSTQDSAQLARACKFLATPGSQLVPTYDTALRRAASFGHIFELKILIRHIGGALNKTDEVFRYTALQFAVWKQNYICAELLIKAGASLDSRDKYGQTALHLAIKNEDRRMIQLLIRSGASLNISDKRDKTPRDYISDRAGILASFILECQAERKALLAVKPLKTACCVMQ